MRGSDSVDVAERSANCWSTRLLAMRLRSGHSISARSAVTARRPMAAKNGASGGGGIDGVLASVMDSGAPSSADAAWESAIWTGRIGESRLGIRGLATWSHRIRQQQLSYQIGRILPRGGVGRAQRRARIVVGQDCGKSDRQTVGKLELMLSFPLP